ncbi:MAG: PD40 domain-containing protein [Cyclobacteriaceae bacterium]|nr:PD40 domain-containing protein [Cyclobacteriaceae bacterium]
MKHTSKVLALLTTWIWLSCAPSINYLTTSVPEEGGIKFTQFTNDDEVALGPSIRRNAVTGVLEWYAAPLIAISPDGSRLSFLGKKDNKDNIFIKNTAGGRSTIQRTFRNQVNDMAFSPDGSKIAFTDSRLDQLGNFIDSDIYMINTTEGAAVQQVTTTPLVELGPCFAPDGKSLYFTKSDGGRYYIWNVNLQSSLLTQYSEGFTPALSKDGKMLVITRNNKSTTRGEIWSIDLVTGTETLILNSEKMGFSSPQLSPDGELIVCVGSTEKLTNTPENLNIYTIRPDGTRLTQLTFHPGHDVSPVWAPDGKSIYFISQRGNPTGKFNVWRMEFNK